MLHGDNGAGKTNLLEAVNVLATLRSFRDARTSRWVREGRPGAQVEGRVDGPAGERTLCWRQINGERQLLMDGGPVGLRPWFETLTAILFSPETVVVVRGEPEARRRLVDRAAFTARPAHLDLVRDYRRVILQKGALLRSGRVSMSELDTWDERVAELGAQIRLRRWELVCELVEPFQEAVRLISSPRGVSPDGAGGDRVGLRLRSEGGESEGLEAARSRLRAAISAARPEELRQASVLVGPHRDDLEISVNGRSARRFASQGQSRTLALALKLGELEAARRRGQSPLFLLDDLTSELDQGRRERLVAHLLELNNQIWVTTTDKSYLGSLPTERSRVLRVTPEKVWSEDS